MTTQADCRNGGLTLVALHGRAHMAAIGRKGLRRAHSVYADTDDARRLRAQDCARKRYMDAATWDALMRRRQEQFGLPEGTLIREESSNVAAKSRRKARL